MSKQHSPAFLALVEDALRRVEEVDIAGLRARQERGEPFHLLDVREESEFAQDRIPGARHLGKGVIERDIEAAVPGKDEELILYCGGGFRSALAGDALQRMGYTRVRSLAGGIRAWRGQGLPLER